MSPETVQAIQKALEPIAAKIGQGAQYGWAIVVKQQFITGIVDTAALAIGFVWLLITLITLSLMTERDWKAQYVTPKGVALLVLGTITFVWLMFSLLAFSLDNALGRLLNPEYYALDFFIHLSK